MNGAYPGPEIRLKEGNVFRTIAENAMTDEEATLHWHGIINPCYMDGVPDVTQLPIPSNRSFVYEYPVVRRPAPTGITHMLDCRS